MDKIEKTLTNNIDKAYDKFCKGKNKDLSKGYRQFMEINIGPFITQLCKKYEVDEKEFYDYLVDRL